MKKFLTMLLALSVVFTYTFGAAGSVFAATYDNTDKYIEAVNTAEEAALEYEAAQYAVAVAQAKTAKTVDVTYSGAAKITVDTAYYLTQLEDVYAAIKNNIKNVQTKGFKSATGTPNNGKIDFTEPAYVTYDANTMLTWAKSNTTLGTVELNCATALIAAQLDANKADAVKNVGTVDTTIYSTTKLEETSALTFRDINLNTVKCYSAKEYADALKVDYVARINACVYDKDADTLAKVGKKVADLATYVASIIEDANNDGVYTMKASILKAADEDAANAEQAAKIAAAKSTIQSNIASEYAEAIKKENYNKAEWDKLVAAYTTVANYLAENATYPYDPVPIPTNYVFNKDTETNVVTIAETNTGYINAVANADLLKAAVAEVKAEKNADGTVKYIAKSVDAAAEVAVAAEYNAAPSGTVVAKTATEARTALASASTVEGYVTEMTKAKLIKAATDKYEAAEYDKNNKATTYYPTEYATYKTALDAYVVAVNAAVTRDDLTKAATDLNTALRSIKKASQITYVDTTTDKAATALDNAKATAAAYVATLNVGKATDDQITYGDDAVTEFLMYNGARDAAGIVALYDALKADIAKTETTNQAKAAAEAVQAKIDALPATLTLTSADEASVLEVKAAYDELSDVAKGLVNNADLNLAVKKVKELVNADITAAAKAINKDLDENAAKISDKAALQAVAEKCEAFAKNYKPATADAADYVTKALAKVKELECKAVVDAVKALPTDITKEDKAAVEAARAAYDAYVAEYTDLANGKDGAADLKRAGINLEKLQAAEATIAELTKYTDKDVKADLLDMTRKVTIWRTSKTSIRVTAVGSVANITDNGYTVKYTFYKKAPGAKAYKAIKTTTSNKYTYTNLKKGTNKFQIKVKVYDAEGKLVASKMTYYRAAKVK